MRAAPNFSVPLHSCRRRWLSWGAGPRASSSGEGLPASPVLSWAPGVALQGLWAGPILLWSPLSLGPEAWWARMSGPGGWWSQLGGVRLEAECLGPARGPVLGMLLVVFCPLALGGPRGTQADTTRVSRDQNKYNHRRLFSGCFRGWKFNIKVPAAPSETSRGGPLLLLSFQPLVAPLVPWQWPPHSNLCPPVCLDQDPSRWF